MDTLRAKLGQMIMTGCSGERISPAERTMFSGHRPGGVILFEHNCAEPRQMLTLCRQLWQSSGDEPPFIAIDQEGGRVHRLPPPFTRFPAATTIGGRRDPLLAYRAGFACAAELALVGINLDFAPVLDVNSEAANPVIGDRTFGSDPDSALAWARGLREGGVLPCGKHFPGHGATIVDSHCALPVIDKTSAELEALELPPFVAACRSRIEALMTAHVKFTALDPCHPATLSEPVVTGLLRRRLNYDGVVFSDDLEMNAICDDHSPGEAAFLALSAGVDVMLFGHDSEKAVQALECLYTEADRSPALRARVDASHRRITELKRRRLSSFGASANELEVRLASLRHEKLVAEIHGSL